MIMKPLAIPREILALVEQLDARSDGWTRENARQHLEAIQEFIRLALEEG